MIKTTKDGRTIRSGIHYTKFRHEIYRRCSELCEDCNRWMLFCEMELHHIYGRGGGKRDDVSDKVRGLCCYCHEETKIKRREPVDA